MAISLKDTCYTTHTGAVVESKLEDHKQHIQTAARPGGVGYKYYTTTINKLIEEEEIEAGIVIKPAVYDDVWVLAKWIGREIVVKEFESEADADEAAELNYVDDILNNSEYPIFLFYAEAKMALGNKKSNFERAE